MKKLIALVLVCLFMLTVIPSALATTPADNGKYGFDKDAIMSLAGKFILDYNKAFETLAMPDFEYVEKGDGTALFVEMLAYQIEYRSAFNDPYVDVSLRDIVLKDLKVNGDTASAEVYGLVNFYYIDQPRDMVKGSNGYGMNYYMEFKNLDGALKIVMVDTDSNDYDYHKSLINSKMMQQRTTLRSAAKAVADELIAKLPITVKLWNEQAAQYDKNARTTFIDEPLDSEALQPDPLDEFATNAITPMAAVSFNAESARYYGWYFGDWTQNDIFRRMEDGGDCTNFVSQCIWAGYGGSSGYGYGTYADREALRVRVSQNYRQTSTWMGRNFLSTNPLASGPFMRVLELWSHATTNTGNGPRASGYNDGNIWSALTETITAGDVLQFHNGSRYYHSVIVSSSTSYSGVVALDYTFCAQHSGDYYYRKLRDVLENNGGIESGKMRLMKFKSSSFSS